MPAKAPAAKPAKAPAAKPAKEAAKPAKEAAKPAKEAVKPAKEAAKPAKEAVKPAKEAAKPAKEAAKPAKPAKDAAKPAKDAAKPAKPAKEAAKPTKEAPKEAAKDNKGKPVKPAAKAPAKTAPKAAPPKAAAPKKEAKASTGLYVKHWGRSGVAAAKGLFAGFGTVTSVRLRRGKFCQVWFDNAVAAKKAIESVKKDKRGRQLQAVAAKTQPKPDRRENTRVVCAKPIYRQSITRKRLLAFFGETGKVVKLRTYANNTAYVYYDSPAAAAKTIAEKSGKVFMTHTLTITPSVRSLEADKKKEARRRTLIDLTRWVRTQRAS